MIKNPSPAKMVLSSASVGYTKALVYHSPFSDPDTIGKTFWIQQGSDEVAKTSTDLVTFYMILDSLEQNTEYTLSGAYWDSMVDEELLENKIGLLISEPTTITTLLAPAITDYDSEVEQAVVGVGTAYLVLKLEGVGQLVEIQITDGNTAWTPIYSGELKDEIRIPNLEPGTYKVRCRGRVALPDGFTTDISEWNEFPQNVVVDYAFIPPSKPTNISFTAAKISDGNERYDVQVRWDWSKDIGANIREFVLYYVSKDEFNSTGWSKASRINSGATQAAVISSFPWEVATIFKVESKAWGPDDMNSAASDTAEFYLDATTPLDSSFTKETGIEISYAYIKGQKKINNKWEQTFLLNASDGTVSIGLLDANGVAPISMDPVTNSVNIDGKLISKEIYSASIVLSNLTGKDNPNIRTTGKTYGGDAAGVWMGMGNNNKPLFDVGNKNSFIRFDGDKTWISSGVTIGTPNGDITLGEGITGIRQVTIYQLNTSSPSIPTSQDYPPAGWYTTPPSISDPFTQKIYASTGRLDPVTNKLVSGTNYSQPVQWSGTSGGKGDKGDPGGNGAPGTPGAPGTRGPGFYRQGRSAAGWSDADATAFFRSTFNSTPVQYDVLTQYHNTNPKNSVTRQWNGSSWINPALMLHGDMILDGTLTAKKIVADQAFFAQTGINVIYNRDAALSSNPEATYKMKIDLQVGSIHIR